MRSHESPKVGDTKGEAKNREGWKVGRISDQTLHRGPNGHLNTRSKHGGHQTWTNERMSLLCARDVYILNIIDSIYESKVIIGRV